MIKPHLILRSISNYLLHIQILPANMEHTETIQWKAAENDLVGDSCTNKWDEMREYLEKRWCIQKSPISTQTNNQINAVRDVIIPCTNKHNDESLIFLMHFLHYWLMVLCKSCYWSTCRQFTHIQSKTMRFQYLPWMCTADCGWRKMTHPSWESHRPQLSSPHKPSDVSPDGRHNLDKICITKSKHKSFIIQWKYKGKK